VLVCEGDRLVGIFTSGICSRGWPTHPRLRNYPVGDWMTASVHIGGRRLDER